MVDSTDNGLGYGHFGEGFYDTENKSWIWKRDLNCPQHIATVGKPFVAFQPSLENGGDANNDLHIRRTTRLVKALPNVAPASKSLTGDNELFQNPDLTSHDSTIGTLLAYGKIRDDITSRRVMAVAFPSDSSRNVLHIAQAQWQRQGWQRDKSIWLDVPIVQGDSGSWNARSPICQIAFSESNEGRSAFLAVRTVTAIWILRPVFRQRVVSDHVAFGPSRLEVKVVTAITADLTGSALYTHVTFNPWYPQQFGVVDEKGDWRIWETGSGHGNDGGQVRIPVKVSSGHIRTTGMPDEDVYDDGLESSWSKCVWVGSLNTFLVGGRQTLTIFDVTTRPVGSEIPNLGLSQDGASMLDFTRDPLHLDRLYVLTTIHFFCLAFTPSDRTTSSVSESLMPKMLLKVRHFRDSRDTSLRLVLVDDGADTILMIRSSLTQSISWHRLVPNVDLDDVVAASDVTMLTLDKPHDSLVHSATFQLVHWADSTVASSSRGIGHNYRSHDVQFWLATFLTKDLRVAQQIIQSVPASYEGSFSILPPTWRSRIAQSSFKAGNLPFIVPDGFDVRDSHTARVVQKPDEMLLAVASINEAAPRVWSIDCGRILPQLDESRIRNGQDVSSVLALVSKWKVANQEKQESSLQLFKDFAPRQVLVPDLDEAAEILHELTESLDSQQRHPRFPSADGVIFEIMRLADEVVLGLTLEDARENDLTRQYNHMIALFLSPLDERVAGRVRLAKEQLVRRIAAQICLSSYCIRPVLRLGDHATQASVDGILHGSALDHSSQLSQIPSSQLSLPPSSPSPNASTSLASPSTSNPNETTTRIARLQRFVRLDATKAPTTTSIRNVQTLAHWDLHTTPETYSYTATQSRLQHDLDALASTQDLSERDLARARRQAERFAERQRREQRAAEAERKDRSAPGLLLSSQTVAAETPGVGRKRRREGFGISGMESQPLAYRGGVLSSQDGASSSQSQNQSQEPGRGGGEVTASQIEPGRFGGRRTVMGPPARKKRRTQGF